MAAGRQVWEVVGGGDKGGIVVRQGEATDSPLVQERLRTGSLVAERCLSGERLHYERLTGAGPHTGWVSLRLSTGREMMARSTGVWEVVGGGDKGGIVVREGRDVSSTLLGERLSTGALVRELSLEGDRLQFARLSGTGPSAGWVSVKLRDADKVLVARCGAAPAAEVASKAEPGGVLSAMPERPVGPVTNRKMRIAGIHGTPANSNIMKFQCSLLRKALGSDAEWVFPDAPTPWAPNPGTGFANDEERSDFEKRLAQGKDFVQWYYTQRHGAGYHDDEWLYVDECILSLWEFFARNAPIDVVVAFSQGSSMVGILIEVMRIAGQKPPWRGNVFFNGGNVDDSRYDFKAQCDLPTVYVAGGAADPFGAYITGEVQKMYTSLTLLEHGDGHSFPSTQPRANEVMEEVTARVRSLCGVKAKERCVPAPQKAVAPQKAAVVPQRTTAAAVAATKGALDDGIDEFPPGMWTVDYIGQARGGCKMCKCGWYQWNPNKLRPERGDSGDATITEWFLNDYDSLRCQACRCKFSDHRSLGPVNKPAGFHPGLDEADVNALMGT